MTHDLPEICGKIPEIYWFCGITRWNIPKLRIKDKMYQIPTVLVVPVTEDIRSHVPHDVKIMYPSMLINLVGQ